MSTVYSAHGSEFRFNDHICVEMLMGVPDEKRTGRLVQVRKGVGSFCTDQYLVRLRDGTLMCFHNVMLRHVGDKEFEYAFYQSNGRTPPVIPDQPPLDDDREDVEYLIADGFPEVGFIVESPKQPHSPHQSFSMRIEQKAP